MARTIVHSCTSVSFSGLERYLVDLATWQHKQGEKVLVFCRKGSPIAEALGRAGVMMWAIPLGERLTPWLMFKMFRRWRRLIKEGPVILHLHHTGELWFHRLWMQSFKFKKIILQMHLWLNHKKKDPFHAWLYEAVDELWCSTDAAREHLRALLPMAAEKFRVVPYGRDVAVLQNLPREGLRHQWFTKLGIPENAVVAVTVSRLEPVKGVGELFDAFVQEAPFAPQAHLVVVGGASPENEEALKFEATLKARHEALHDDVRKRIHFVGMVPESEKLVAACDVYVLPSYEECMSLALLDALIVGVPAIGTATGGTPCVVREGETGLLVLPRDVTALQAALNRMFSDPLLRARLGDHARVFAARFDRERIFREVLHDYES